MNIDHLETWLVSTERHFQGLSGTIRTIEIIEELMEIWLDEVCDNWFLRVEIYKEEYKKKNLLFSSFSGLYLS